MPISDQNCRSLFSNLASLPLTGRPFLKIQKSCFYKIYLYKRCWHKIINKSMFPVQNLKKSTTKCKFDPFFEDRKCNSHLFSAILPIAIFFICLIFHTWSIVAWCQTIQKSLCGNLDFRDTKNLIFSPNRQTLCQSLPMRPSNLVRVQISPSIPRRVCALKILHKMKHRRFPDPF